MGVDGWSIQVLAVVVGSAVVLLLGRSVASQRSSGAAIVGVGGALGCGVLLVTQTRAMSGGTLADIGRYNTPSALAIVLFLLGELWWLATTTREQVATADADSSFAPWRIRFRATACATTAVAFATIPVVAALPIIPPHGGIHALPTAIWAAGKQAVASVTGRATGSIDQFGAMKPTYNAIALVIPPGARVLSAVSAPDLLDFSRYTFVTLDIAGAASPAPGIPLTGGGSAVVTYLRRLGFDGIVASVTSAPGLYNYRGWQQNTSSGVENYRAMATEFTAWAHDLSQLNHNPAVRRFRIGSLEYLDWSTPGARQ
jgi:hypothetical protein